MRHTLKTLLGSGLLAATLSLATGAMAQTPVTFQLNWTAGGANAGFAAAVGEGYYKAVGLDVTLVQGNGSGNTAQLVANGRAQLAYADAVAVSQLIAKGAPMKMVSTICCTCLARLSTPTSACSFCEPLVAQAGVLSAVANRSAATPRGIEVLIMCVPPLTSLDRP